MPDARTSTAPPPPRLLDTPSVTTPAVSETNQQERTFDYLDLLSNMRDYQRAHVDEPDEPGAPRPANPFAAAAAHALPSGPRQLALAAADTVWGRIAANIATRVAAQGMSPGRLKLEFGKGVARAGLRLGEGAFQLRAQGESLGMSVLNQAFRVITGAEIPERTRQINQAMNESAMVAAIVHEHLSKQLDEPGGLLAYQPVIPPMAGTFPWDDPGYWAGGAGESFTFLATMLVPGLGVGKVAQAANVASKLIKPLQIAASAATSAAIESGLSYGDFVEGLQQRGLSFAEANEVAAYGAGGYGIVAGLLDVVPLSRFLEKGVPRANIARALIAMAAEGVTEELQEEANMATERILDIYEPGHAAQRRITSTVLGTLGAGPIAAYTTAGEASMQRVIEDTDHKSFSAMAAVLGWDVMEQMVSQLKPALESKNPRDPISGTPIEPDDADRMRRLAKWVERNKPKPTPAAAPAAAPVAETAAAPAMTPGMTPEQAASVEEQVDTVVAEVEAATAEAETAAAPEPATTAVDGPISVNDLDALGDPNLDQSVIEQLVDTVEPRKLGAILGSLGASQAAIDMVTEVVETTMTPEDLTQLQSGLVEKAGFQQSDLEKARAVLRDAGVTAPPAPAAEPATQPAPAAAPAAATEPATPTAVIARTGPTVTQMPGEAADKIGRLNAPDDIKLAGEGGARPLMTGDPLTIQAFRGTGRAPGESVLAPGVTENALGPGRYSALSEPVAATFGPVVEPVQVNLKNPAVIRDSKQLRKWAERGGWVGGEIPLENAAREPFLKAVRKGIEGAGHDGAVVIIEGMRDVSTATGQSFKRMREIFDVSQVVEFPKGQPAPMPRVSRDTQARAGLFDGSTMARRALVNWRNRLSEKGLFDYLAFLEHFVQQAVPALSTTQQEIANKMLLFVLTTNEGDSLSSRVSQIQEAYEKIDWNRVSPQAKLAIAALDMLASTVGQSVVEDTGFAEHGDVDDAVATIAQNKTQPVQQWNSLVDELGDVEPFDRVPHITNPDTLKTILAIVKAMRDDPGGVRATSMTTLATLASNRLKELRGGQPTAQEGQASTTPAGETQEPAQQEGFALAQETDVVAAEARPPSLEETLGGKVYSIPSATRLVESLRKSAAVQQNPLSTLEELLHSLGEADQTSQLENAETVIIDPGDPRVAEMNPLQRKRIAGFIGPGADTMRSVVGEDVYDAAVDWVVDVGPIGNELTRGQAEKIANLILRTPEAHDPQTVLDAYELRRLRVLSEFEKAEIQDAVSQDPRVIELEQEIAEARAASGKKRVPKSDQQRMKELRRKVTDLVKYQRQREGTLLRQRKQVVVPADQLKPGMSFTILGEPFEVVNGVVEGEDETVPVLYSEAIGPYALAIADLGEGVGMDPGSLTEPQGEPQSVLVSPGAPTPRAEPVLQLTTVVAFPTSSGVPLLRVAFSTEGVTPDVVAELIGANDTAGIRLLKPSPSERQRSRFSIERPTESQIMEVADRLGGMRDADTGPASVFVGLPIEFTGFVLTNDPRGPTHGVPSMDVIQPYLDAGRPIPDRWVAAYPELDEAMPEIIPSGVFGDEGVLTFARELHDRAAQTADDAVYDRAASKMQELTFVHPPDTLKGDDAAVQLQQIIDSFVELEPPSMRPPVVQEPDVTRTLAQRVQATTAMGRSLDEPLSVSREDLLAAAPALAPLFVGVDPQDAADLDFLDKSMAIIEEVAAGMNAGEGSEAEQVIIVEFLSSAVEDALAGETTVYARTEYLTGATQAIRDALSEAGITTELSSQQIYELMNRVGMDAIDKALGRAPSAEALAASRASSSSIMFVSGLQRSPADLKAAKRLGQPIGVSLTQALSGTVADEIVDYANHGGQVFIDNGAFTAFTSGEEVNWSAIGQRWLDLLARINPDALSNLHIVAPDSIAGGQDVTMELQHQAAQDWLQPLIAAGVNLIVPLHAGTLTPEAALSQLSNDIDVERITWGIPSNVRAWSDGKIVMFVKRMQKKGLAVRPIHMLGAGAERVARMRGEIQKIVPGLPVNGDASRIRKLVGEGKPLTERVRELIEAKQSEVGRPLTRSERSAARTQAIVELETEAGQKADPDGNPGQFLQDDAGGLTPDQDLLAQQIQYVQANGYYTEEQLDAMDGQHLQQIAGEMGAVLPDDMIETPENLRLGILNAQMRVEHALNPPGIDPGSLPIPVLSPTATIDVPPVGPDGPNPAALHRTAAHFVPGQAVFLIRHGHVIGGSVLSATDPDATTLTIVVRESLATDREVIEADISHLWTIDDLGVTPADVVVDPGKPTKRGVIEDVDRDVELNMDEIRRMLESDSFKAISKRHFRFDFDFIRPLLQDGAIDEPMAKVLRLIFGLSHLTAFEDVFGHGRRTLTDDKGRELAGKFEVGPTFEGRRYDIELKIGLQAKEKLWTILHELGHVASEFLSGSEEGRQWRSIYQQLKSKGGLDTFVREVMGITEEEAVRYIADDPEEFFADYFAASVLSRHLDNPTAKTFLQRIWARVLGWLEAMRARLSGDGAHADVIAVLDRVVDIAGSFVPEGPTPFKPPRRRRVTRRKQGAPSNLFDDENAINQPDAPGPPEEPGEMGPALDLFGNPLPTITGQGVGGQQTGFGFMDASALDRSMDADAARKRRQLAADKGETSAFDFLSDVRLDVPGQPTPPGFFQIRHMGRNWLAREGIGETERGSEAEANAARRAIEAEVRRGNIPPGGGPAGAARRAFVDLGIFAPLIKPFVWGAQKGGRLAWNVAKGTVNWAVIDMIDLVGRSGEAGAREAARRGRAAVDTTKETIGILSPYLRAVMRAGGGWATQPTRLADRQRAAYNVQRVQWSEDESWGVARIIDLVEGRLEPETPAEQRLISALRALIDRNGQLFRDNNHLQYRDGEWQPFKYVPGGRVFPRVMHINLIGIIAKGEGPLFNAVVNAIVDANEEFLVDLVSLTDAQIEAGMDEKDVYREKIRNLMHGMREAFMGLGKTPEFHRINAEFARDMPRMPSHIRVGSDKLEILETHPWVYGRRLADTAASRVGFIAHFGQAIGGWLLTDEETGEILAHRTTKGEATNLHDGLTADETRLNKFGEKRLKAVLLALKPDANTEGLGKDALIGAILAAQLDQPTQGVGNVKMEEMPNVIENLRERIGREKNGSPKRLLAMTRVLNGMPAEPPIIDAGSPIREFARGLKLLTSLARTGLLTMSVVPNIPEFFGNAQALNNTGDLLKAIWTVFGVSHNPDTGQLQSNFMAAVATLEAMGAITADLANISYNPNRPFESIARFFQEAVGRVPPRILLEELQERFAAILALHKVQRLQNGRGNSGDIIDLMSMMGWSREHAESVVRGHGTELEYLSIVRRAPAFMTGGAIRAAERTMLSQKPLYKLLIAFELYAQVKVRSLHGLATAYAKAFQARDAKLFLAANMKMARYVAGTTVSGTIAYFLMALATGGWDGLEIAWDEMKDHPWTFFYHSFLYSMFAGPYGSIIRMASENDGAPWYEHMIRATLPGFLIDETVRCLSGAGSYRNTEMMERVGMFFNRMLPVTKVYATSMAMFGIGNYDKSLKMQTAVRAYWRWRFDTGRRPPGGDQGDVSGEDQAFRTAMRQALDARRSWADPRPYIHKALRVDGSSAAKVRKSILARRLLIGFSQADLRELQNRIGENAMQQLRYHDAIMTGWAQGFSTSGGDTPAWVR